MRGPNVGKMQALFAVLMTSEMHLEHLKIAT